MIFLIDDKKARQSDYGWTKDKFANYSSIISVVYNYQEFESVELQEAIFSPNNVIIFHESFVDNELSHASSKSLEIRKKLEAYANNNPFNKLVFFSGSKNSRFLNKNIAHLPVEILYKNLEVFIKNYELTKGNLETLLFGNNAEVEKIMHCKLKIWNALYSEKELPSETMSKSYNISEQIKLINSLKSSSLSLSDYMNIKALKFSINE